MGEERFIEVNPLPAKAWERTMALRYVKKPLGDFMQPGKLQQAWHDRFSGEIEWRDIETVIEGL